jgi:hypothetical protein
VSCPGSQARLLGCVPQLSRIIAEHADPLTWYHTPHQVQPPP